MVYVAADRRAIGDLPQEVAFPAIEGFEQHAGAGLVRVLAQFDQEFDQEFAGFLVSQLGLVMKSGHHDHAHRTKRSGGGKDFLHRAKGLLANFLLLRDQDAIEPGANGAELDFSPLQRFLQFLHSLAQVAPAHFQSLEAVGFQKIELFREGASRRDPFLAGEAQPRFLRRIGQGEGLGGRRQDAGGSGGHGYSQEFTAIQFHSKAA